MKYFFLLAVVIFAACSSATNKPLKNMERLNGLWQMNIDEGDLYEEWEIVNDSLMLGKGYVMNGPDSLVNERVRIISTDSGIYYMPLVTDQNNGKEVAFKLVVQSDTMITFENKLHDNPQRIIYRFINNDSINARVEGVKDSLPQLETYSYRRIKR